ncbi:MAG: hypothetical protein R3A12_13225 [Ignavibacteria bacterium]
MKYIYKFLNPNVIPEQVRTSINELTDYENGSFSQKKAKINRKIKSLLGDTRAQDFLISGRPGQPFRINLQLENMDINF